MNTANTEIVQNNPEEHLNNETQLYQQDNLTPAQNNYLAENVVGTILEGGAPVEQLQYEQPVQQVQQQYVYEAPQLNLADGGFNVDNSLQLNNLTQEQQELLNQTLNNAA